MKNTAILTLSIILLAGIAAADSTDPETLNTYQNQSSYNLLNKSPINLTATFRDNETGLDTAILSTNETGEFKNRTEYETVDLGNVTGSKVNATFNWTNENDLSRDKTIGWKIYGNNTKGNTSVTSTSTFTVFETPQINSIDTEDVEPEETSKITVRAWDLNGRDDIVNVTLKITGPEETTEITMRKGSKITVSGEEGYIYTANYSQTQNQGIYELQATVKDEKHSSTENTEFKVSDSFLPAIKGFKVSPAYLGSNTVIQGTSKAITENQSKLILGISGIVAFLIVFITLLGPGFDETDFKRDSQPLNPDKKKL